VRALLEALGAAELAPWLTAWPAAAHEPPQAPRAAALPVLEWLPAAVRAAPAFSAPLCAALQAAAAGLAWHRSYTPADVTAGAIEARFLDRYGWCELQGPRALGERYSGALACGFLLLGPDVHYPAHCHEAEELYLPLSGSAAWRRGEALWHERKPGALIHHASLEPHAMRTGTDPLLALYLWRGRNLAGSARLHR
jgi:hypothetical protein